MLRPIELQMLQPCREIGKEIAIGPRQSAGTCHQDIIMIGRRMRPHDRLARSLEPAPGPVAGNRVADLPACSKADPQGCLMTGGIDRAGGWAAVDRLFAGLQDQSRRHELSSARRDRQEFLAPLQSCELRQGRLERLKR